MIGNSVKTPLATLRGHNVGVTAIAQCNIDGNCYLLSGDEEGSIVVWDLAIFRKLLQYTKLIISRTQCLKVISLTVSGVESKVLIAQSRNDGIYLLNLTEAVKSTTTNSIPKPLAAYPSYSALFSKCDAKNFEQSRALLVHPSCIENHLVTLRLIGDDGKTLSSGSAQRFDQGAQKTCVVFDLLLSEGPTGQFFLFVAYEDGQLCLFSFRPYSTKTVPILNSTGLKIDLIRSFGLGTGDFLSAFDVASNKEKTNYLAICGSPSKNLTFLSYKPNEPELTICELVELSKRGVAAVCIRPDKKLVAVASWNATIRLYSMKSQKLLAVLNHHSKQVQSILFIEQLETHRYLKGARSDNRTTTTRPSNGESNAEKRYLLCCASMEGTISISAVY